MSAIANHLRETTERMAHEAHVRSELWNVHSNAALAAAKEIERLEDAIRAVVEKRK